MTISQMTLMSNKELLKLEDMCIRLKGQCYLKKWK